SDVGSYDLVNPVTERVRFARRREHFKPKPVRTHSSPQTIIAVTVPAIKSLGAEEIVAGNRADTATLLVQYPCVGYISGLVKVVSDNREIRFPIDRPKRGRINCHSIQRQTQWRCTHGISSTRCCTAGVCRG